MISGRVADAPNQARSNLKIPREKRALREVIANISDIPHLIDAYSYLTSPAYQGIPGDAEQGMEGGLL